jgi:DNA-binding CsgD family transcriptional regulator
MGDIITNGHSAVSLASRGHERLVRYGGEPMRFEHFFEDYVTASQAADSMEQLKEVFERFASDEGYDNHVFASVGERQLTSVCWFRLPDGYADAYIANGWECIDPMLPAARRAVGAFSWADVLIGLKLSSAQKRFFDECHELGVSNGMVFPMRGPDDQCDIISLSCRTKALLDTARVPLLQAVAAQTWYRYKTLTGGQFLNTNAIGIRLTPREREVLKWIKAGKTNIEISEIFGVSSKAIEFHVSNVLNKFGAPNRLAAVVIALERGMLG